MVRSGPAAADRGSASRLAASRAAARRRRLEARCYAVVPRGTRRGGPGGRRARRALPHSVAYGLEGAEGIEGAVGVGVVVAGVAVTTISPFGVAIVPRWTEQ